MNWKYSEKKIPSQWMAQWIGKDDREMPPFDRSVPFYVADDYNKGENQYYLPPVPYFRKTFILKKKVKTASVYFSAFGLIRLYLNGSFVGDDLFVPGNMDYPKRVYARGYDVTALLNQILSESENVAEIVLGAELSDGWYAGYMGLNNRQWYGNKPRLMVQLELSYEDGTTEIIVSDKSWKSELGMIREADLFEGEYWDANLEIKGWKEPGFDDASWKGVDLGCEYPLLPQAHPGDPVVVHGEVQPKALRQTAEDTYMVDFDSYICGILQVKVRGEKGSSIILRFAELLKEDGSLWLEGNRSARNQDQYILKGEGEEIFRPVFTYHGFRHAKIQIRGKAEILEVTGVQIGSQLKSPTRFHCSSETVNQIFDMIHATEKSNLFTVPTDCTARDERLGWGMEGNHFLRAMTYFHDLSAFLEKWAQDIFDGQRPDGGLEAIAPPLVMKDVEQYIGDLQSYHGLMMVHTLYKMYGRIDQVQKFYPNLEKFFEYIDHNSDRFLRSATSCDWLGIWESTGHSDTDHGYGECVPTIIGTAHYGLAAKMMKELSLAIGKTEEAEKYQTLYENIRKAFGQNYIRRDGTLRNGKQGEYVLGLAAGFFPEEEKVLNLLLDKVTEQGYVRWYGGTPSSPYFLSVLKAYGREDVANQFLTSRRYPSFGYMLEKGFDTTWERWDAIHEDGSIHPQPMNAISHEGLAAMGDYLIYGLAGIQCAAPGFTKVNLVPGVSKEITSCHALYHSIQGDIETDWKLQEDQFEIQFSVPEKVTAHVELPWSQIDGKDVEICGIDRCKVQRKGTKAVFEVTGGCHHVVIG